MLLYNDLIHQLIGDMAQRLPELSHLRAERIGVLAAARSGGHPSGTLATCYGLRHNQPPSFSIWTRNGSRQVIAVSQWFRFDTPRIRLHGHELSYLILLRLPRLLLHSPLPTIIHELFHISERFDRQMRPIRHGQAFNREVRRLTRRWLDVAPDSLARLAQLRLPELERQFGAVLAQAVPARFTVPLVRPCESPQSHRSAILDLYPGYRLEPRFRIEPVGFSSEAAPETITEKDLVLRHYTRKGSERVPAAFARYSRRFLPLSA